MNPGPVLALAGARGLVGEEILKVLEERGTPLRGLRLWSRQPQGRRRLFRGEEIPYTRAGAEALAGCDILLHAGPAASGHSLGLAAEAAGVAFVDLSEAWRLEPRTPLVLPELLQAAGLPDSPARRWALPNCTVTGPALVLVPLARRYGLQRLSLTTLQAVSGLGRRALAAFATGAAERPVREEAPPGLPRPGDLLPWCGGAPEAGRRASPEERSVEAELRRLLAPAAPHIEVFCLRAPVRRGHGATLWVETEAPLEDTEALRAILPAAVHWAASPAPGPGEAAGRPELLLARPRWDPAEPRRLGLWLAWDNLHCGAALPAVRLVEILGATLRG